MSENSVYTHTLTPMTKSSRYIIAIHEYSRESINYDLTCYFYIEKCENNTKKVLFFGNRKSENFSEISFSFSYRDDGNIYTLVNFIKKILSKQGNTHSLHLYIVENDYLNITNSSLDRITYKYINGLERNNILKPITTYNDNNIMLFDDIKMLLQFIINTDDVMIDFV